MAKYGERIQAREFRQNGISIKLIAKTLGVSRGTVSLWCEDIELTEQQRMKLVDDDKRGGALGRSRAAISIKNERLNRVEKYRKEGRSLVGDLNERDLLIAGIALYWAEGNKKNRRLVFSNSNPKMIRVCIKWLTNCLKISTSDIYCQVGINQLHKDRVNSVEKYWSEVTGIPIGSFKKVSLKKILSSKVYRNINEHFGTLNIIVRKSTNLNYLVLGFIEALGEF